MQSRADAAVKSNLTTKDAKIYAKFAERVSDPHMDDLSSDQAFQTAALRARSWHPDNGFCRSDNVLFGGRIKMAAPDLAATQAEIATVARFLA